MVCSVNGILESDRNFKGINFDTLIQHDILFPICVAQGLIKVYLSLNLSYT